MTADRKSWSVADLMEQASIHREAGRIREADACYRKILRLQPDHAGALSHSGILARQSGQTDLAVTLITRATEKDPHNAAYWFHLGVATQARGDIDAAIGHYRRAASLDPSLPSLHQKIGNALLEKNHFVEAAASFARELGNRPDCAETINSLGGALHQLGRLQQAMVCYRKAIALQPRYPEALNNLGIALSRLGQSDAAIAAYREALVANPGFAEAYSNLGEALASGDDFEASVALCQKAIALKPDLSAAYLHLGNAYKGLGQLSDAVRSYQRALFLAPDDGGALNNLAVVYRDQGELQKASEAFHQAIKAKRAFSGAYSGLLYFQAFTRYSPPLVERAFATEWEKAALTDTERAAARQRAPKGGRGMPVPSRAGRKLRVGILTAELGQHAVAEFLEPVLEQLDRARIELTLFPTALFSSPRGQHIRQLIELKGDGFVPLTGVPDGEAAACIRAHLIDILIETTGHTYGNRLPILAHRAAPVQCSYIGYWSTTGLTEMDWFITGTGCDPAIDEHFNEGLWRLPRLAHCYKGDLSLPHGGWTPSPDGAVWVGSFNNYSKIREETLALWASVLHAVPEANLLFEDRAVHEEETHQRICSTLAKFGIGRDRVAFIPYIAGHVRHMSLYERLDVALDTIPFNSGTTAFDTLWMGVPLITLAGNWLGGTLSASVVTAFDHPEWVAQDAEQYVSIVRSLVRDVEGRKELRKHQRARMAASPLCDARAMARALEEAFEAMYDRVC